MSATAFKAIREKLGVTQAVMADGIGVTQGNVSFYEKGQTVPPQVAGRLIEFAKSRGLSITYDDVYGAPKAARRAPAKAA